MRVKICGLKRLVDVQAAMNEGADAVGFVVESPSSRRNLSLRTAGKLMETIPVFATKVAVTSCDDRKTIQRICSTLQPDGLQLHNHNRKLVEAIRKINPDVKLILATAVHNPSSLRLARSSSKYSDAVLADTPSATGMGGTGLTHDWNLTAKLRDEIYPHPLILAGGLTPKNVTKAIRKVKPYAVDVSTGVERKLGVKDPRKIREFIRQAKEAVT